MFAVISASPPPAALPSVPTDRCRTPYPTGERYSPGQRGRTCSHPEYQAIARGRFRPQPKDTSKRLRINDQIRISPVRLIDDEDNQVGVVDLDQAKQRARDAELDLVEVAPGKPGADGRPPVCKIMDYGKWKYAQQKKEQKAKAHAKKSELKGMRLRPNIDDHDLSIKVNKARGFLEDGDKVQFVMLFRGRQMAHKGLALDQMRGIIQTLSDVSKIEQDPKMMGRRATMVLAPDKGKKDATDSKRDKEAEAKQAQSAKA
ncbi:MAG: translation initiation factor IF-3 [Planctomycetota bacterium]